MLITRRPSPTMAGMAAKSAFIRVSWAAFLAASEPPAMAMEQSAAFRAGMSFTPSPVMATLCPAAFMASTSYRFCAGVTRPKMV